MGSSCWNEPKRGDCPNCGAKESAIMGSSEWGHNITCCGDVCGMEVKAKIEANESTTEFNDAVMKMESARATVLEMRYEGIDIGTYPLEATSIWGW